MKIGFLNRIIGTVASVLMLCTLTGCDFLGLIRGHKKNETAVATSDATPAGLVGGGQVLVEAFGKPYVAQAAFNEKLTQLLQASPYTRGVDPETLPSEAKINFLKDWVNFLLIKDVWGKDTKIENDPAFQKKYAEHLEAVKDSLIVEAFVQDLKKNVSVSESEAQDEFNAHKDRYVKTPGGALFAVASFENKNKASDFYRQVRKIESTNEFKERAESAGAEVQELGFVNTSSMQFDTATIGLAPAVRKVIFNKSCAQVTLVDEENQSFVVLCLDKRAPKYFEFEEIKSQVKAMLEESRHKEALDNALEGLRKKAHVVIKEEAFPSTKRSQKGMRVVSKQDLARGVSDDAEDMNDDTNDDGAEQNAE